MGATLDGFPDFFQHAVNSLMASCPGSSIGSGSRSADEQQYLVDTKGLWSPTNAGAAPVGTSNHEVGVGSGAADMSGNLECLHAKAAQFGLHFPIGNEPWHIEPTEELIAAGMEFFGMAGEEQQEPEDSLAGIRSIIFGEAENPVDVPERVAEAFAPEAEPGSERGTEQQSEAFVPEASAGMTGTEGEAMSAVDVAKHYAQAGFTGDALVTMVAISRGESGFRPGVHGDTSITSGTWGPSIGLSQIRSLNSQNGTGGWRDATRLSDPAFNARAAYAISNGGTNFQPWTVYTRGLYQQYVTEAKAAVTALGSAAYQPGGAPPAASVSPQDEPGEDIAGVDELEEMFDPVDITNEIAEMVLNQRRESPIARLGGRMADEEKI